VASARAYACVDMATSKKAGAPARAIRNTPKSAAAAEPKAKRFASVDAYLAAQPPEARAVLERVRAALRRALPHAEEVISYQIPAYRAEGGVVIFFAGWARHFSLYPATEGVVSALAAELEPYEVNHKGTVRFPLDRPVPEELIVRIATLRERELRDAAREKGPTKTAARRAPKAR
jgi:uncharacterized protein YdhG (YjbR/CyaY superfamily)